MLKGRQKGYLQRIRAKVGFVRERGLAEMERRLWGEGDLREGGHSKGGSMGTCRPTDVGEEAYFIVSGL